MTENWPVSTAGHCQRCLPRNPPSHAVSHAASSLFPKVSTLTWLMRLFRKSTQRLPYLIFLQANKQKESPDSPQHWRLLLPKFPLIWGALGVAMGTLHGTLACAELGAACSPPQQLRGALGRSTGEAFCSAWVSRLGCSLGCLTLGFGVKASSLGAGTCPMPRTQLWRWGALPSLEYWAQGAQSLSLSFLDCSVPQAPCGCMDSQGTHLHGLPVRGSAGG